MKSKQTNTIRGLIFIALAMATVLPGSAREANELPVRIWVMVGQSKLVSMGTPCHRSDPSHLLGCRPHSLKKTLLPRPVFWRNARERTLIPCKP